MFLPPPPSSKKTGRRQSVMRNKRSSSRAEADQQPIATHTSDPAPIVVQATTTSPIDSLDPLASFFNTGPSTNPTAPASTTPSTSNQTLSVFDLFDPLNTSPSRQSTTQPQPTTQPTASSFIDLPSTTTKPEPAPQPEPLAANPFFAPQPVVEPAKSPSPTIKVNQIPNAQQRNMARNHEMRRSMDSRNGGDEKTPSKKKKKQPVDDPFAASESDNAGDSGDESTSSDSSAHDDDDDFKTRRRNRKPTIPGGSNPHNMSIDVLAQMKGGTPFLKYGKYGYPHFRQFQLSPDNCRIMWFSKQKKMKDTQISLLAINSIVLGQTTENFARHKAPELARSSFSVIYNGYKKTLDLIAKDPNEFRIWSQGLQELLRLIREHGLDHVKNLQELIMPIHVTRGRRSSINLVDAVTGEEADSKLPAPVVAAVSNSADKQMYKEVQKNFRHLKEKTAKYKLRMKEPAFYTSALHSNMLTIMKKIDESIGRIQSWFAAGQFTACDDEIWRAGVDLEGLKNMMKSVNNR